MKIGFILAGFLIALLSTIWSARNLDRVQDELSTLVSLIEQANEVRASARSMMSEAGARIDSTTLLFVQSKSENTPGLGGHLAERISEGIKSSLERQCDAVISLSDVLTVLQTGNPDGKKCPVDVPGLDTTVSDFLKVKGGDPMKFAVLTRHQQDLESRWREIDRKVGSEVVAKARVRAGLEAEMTFWRSLGAALGLLGLFVALAKDLFS